MKTTVLFKVNTHTYTHKTYKDTKYRLQQTVTKRAILGQNMT